MPSSQAAKRVLVRAWVWRTRVRACAVSGASRGNDRCRSRPRPVRKARQRGSCPLLRGKRGCRQRVGARALATGTRGGTVMSAIAPSPDECVLTRRSGHRGRRRRRSRSVRAGSSGTSRCRFWLGGDPLSMTSVEWYDYVGGREAPPLTDPHPNPFPSLGARSAPSPGAPRFFFLRKRGDWFSGSHHGGSAAHLLRRFAGRTAKRCVSPERWPSSLPVSPFDRAGRFSPLGHSCRRSKHHDSRFCFAERDRPVNRSTTESAVDRS
jgi:hypothetical protein